MNDTDTSSAAQRWRPSVPFLSTGTVAIIAGGMAAAVTGPTDWSHGSWVAAFLVLVAGVAQIGLGAGQASLAPAAPNSRVAAAECVLWNIGCTAVVAGTLLSAPIAVTVGSAPLVAALAIATFVVRGVGRQRLLLALYRVLLVVLLVSIPIGSILAWSRR
ncbi:MAG: hypothetical protein ABIR32_08810 [Ilumatobacteraceae bacterium]